MTGVWVRVYRNGKWVNEEFDRLTNDEMEDFTRRKMEGHGDTSLVAQEAWNWAMHFARWIRDNVREERDDDASRTAEGYDQDPA